MKAMTDMTYLMILSVLTASVYSCILNRTKVSAKNEVLTFNLMCSLVWFVILFLINGATIKLNAQTLIWGCIYGTVQSLFIFFKTKAMSTGSVAVTTLVGNSSLLLSVAVSLIIWKETVGIWDIAGLILLCVSIFLCTHKKSETDYLPSWKYYVVLFLIFAAAVGITFKAFGKSSSAQYSSDMMAVSALVMTLFYFAGCMFGGGVRVKNPACGNIAKFCAAALISGVLSCLYNRLNIYLSANLDAIIFFPFFNGGVVLVSTILGICICRERLAKKQLLGIVLGIASICIIGIL